MRLFVAVELADHVKRAAEATALDLQRRPGDQLRARWVPAGNMHLTVRFIGPVSDERGAAILDALRPAIETPAFDVVVDGCGVFPPHGPPRVLWIGVKEGLASLQAIHNELNLRLASLGLETEDRPFSANLTIARVKEAKPGSAAVTRQALREVRVIPTRCRVDRATVFESRLSPAGPTYSPLLDIRLAGSG
jgi:2'-5' RNA ligase